MGSEDYDQLQSIISQFPYLHRFLEDDFTRKQCKGELKSYLLRGLSGLVRGWTINEFKQHLPTLEHKLAGLASLTGYYRLRPCIRGSSDWDGYQEFLAQIKVALCFKEEGLIKEIEPKLPHREGYGDIILFFQGQDIYYEVNSFKSLAKSIESKKGNGAQKVQNLLKRNPWMTQQDAENEIEISRIVRRLLKKTNEQLPPSNPGILAFETGKGMVSLHKIKTVSSRLLPERPQVALIMYCRSESGSQIGTPPFWFVNFKSRYQNTGQDLLKYLGQNNKALDCK